jgi:hypothetical protein
MACTACGPCSSTCPQRLTLSHSRRCVGPQAMFQCVDHYRDRRLVPYTALVALPLSLAEVTLMLNDVDS